MAVVLAAFAPVIHGVAAASPPSERVEVVVVFDDDVANARRAATDMARDYGARLGHIYEHAVKGFSAEIRTERRAALERDGRVAFVNDNHAVEAFAENVPTGVSRIDSPAAHPTATGVGVRVAVIDTGIDSDHEDLAGNLDWNSGYDCINGDADPEDDQGHGTHVAGTVAAVDNELGVIGVAPAATLVAFKVLGSNGSGSWADVICGIDHVAGLNTDVDTANDIHVANMSLGGSGSLDAGEDCGNTSDALYAAVCGAVASGAVFTVAAGNDGVDASGFVPAAYPEVVTVSAYRDTDGTDGDAGCTGFPFTTCDEEFASFSNYGDIVDVIAPGAGILSTTYDGSYAKKSGTSMAAPHVAGIAALVLEKQPGLSPPQVEAHLRATGQCPNDEENAQSGECLGQGSWKNDPDALTEPMVNAVWATGSTTTSPNTAPVADDTTASGDEDTIVVWTPSASDADADALTCFIATAPAHGSATVASDCSGGTYAPNADYQGTDSFTYAVSDGTATDSGTVSVTVNAVNDAPTANGDAASTTVDTAVSIAVLANDVDVDGDTLSVSQFDANSVQGAAVSCASDGSCTYTPLSGFAGADSFTYTATDGVLTGSATVTIDVSDTSSAALTVTGITPSTVGAGTYTLTITGTGFQDGATVAFENGKGPAPAVTSVAFGDAQTLTVEIIVKSSGPSSWWDVRVTNPDSTSAALPAGLYVSR